MANASLYAAFERFWQHVVTRLSDKSDLNHTHDEYATVEDLNELTTEAGTAFRDIGDAIEDIIDGTIPVAEATHSSTADSATTATKATQDGKGNVIDTTYATNASVNQIATNAQSYIDETINTLAANVAYIDENDNETVTLSVDLDVLASLIGGDA